MAGKIIIITLLQYMEAFSNSAAYLLL